MLRLQLGYTDRPGAEGESRWSMDRIRTRITMGKTGTRWRELKFLSC